MLGVSMALSKTLYILKLCWNGLEYNTLDGVTNLYKALKKDVQNVAKPDKKEQKKWKPNPKQNKLFHKLLGDLKIDYEKEYKNTLKTLYDVDSVNDLTKDQFDLQIKLLEAQVVTDDTSSDNQPSF
jgi:thymidylate synthase